MRKEQTREEIHEVEGSSLHTKKLGQTIGKTKILWSAQTGPYSGEEFPNDLQRVVNLVGIKSTHCQVKKLKGSQEQIYPF